MRKVKPRKVLIREISDSDDESQASYFDPNIDPFSHEWVKYLDGESNLGSNKIENLRKSFKWKNYHPNVKAPFITSERDPELEDLIEQRKEI